MSPLARASPVPARRPGAARLSRRRLLAPAAVAGAGLLGAGGAWLAARSRSAEPPAPAVPTPAPAVVPAVVTYVADTPARPAGPLMLPLRLVVPRLGVDAPIVAVGLTGDGAMDVPQHASEVGWYQYSARPGTKGNAILAGHLDWYGVEGVFRHLAELGKGDAVVVRAADGQERPYAIEWLREFDVASAPVAEIFAPLAVPALTLITCGGQWNPRTRRYDRRVVARAQRG